MCFYECQNEVSGRILVRWGWYHLNFCYIFTSLTSLVVKSARSRVCFCWNYNTLWQTEGDIYYSAFVSRPHCLLLCKQASTDDHDRVNKLLDILLRRDDRQLPLFCDILTADRQPHVVDLLRRNGTISLLCTSSVAFTQFLIFISLLK